MPVHMQDLEKPEQMYRKLGAKLVVGMPFKDQACSDTLVLPEIPPASDTDKRRALARLQVRVCQPCMLDSLSQGCIFACVHFMKLRPAKYAPPAS